MSAFVVPLPAIIDWADVDPDAGTPVGWDEIEVVLIDSQTGEPINRP